MKLSKPWVILTALVLVSLFLLQFEVQANNSNRIYDVTIPQVAVEQAVRLGLDPQVAWDYGSFQWLQLNAGDFARLSASGLPFTHEAEAGTLQVTQFRFDPLVDGEPDVPQALRLEHDGEGFRLIQMVGPANNERLAEIAATGVKLLQYYPHHTYLVWGTAAQAEKAADLAFVRWQGALHPAYKMNNDLTSRAGVVKNVDIFFYNDGQIEATLASIARLGGNILQHFPAQPDRAFYSAIVEMDAAGFEALSQLNTVLWFGFASPEPILEDEMSSQIVAGNHPGGVPVTGYFDHLDALGLSGAGVTWAVIDTGVDYDHPDLGPHIVGGYSFPGACNPPGQPGSDCSGGGHGTHVAGIIGGDATAGFADANGFLYGLGVAPEYGIFAMNSLSASSWPPAGGWQEHSKQAVLGGAIGGNNSWTTGEGTAHGYQASERTHDIMVHDGNFDTASVEPFIQVFSAGNSGPGTSTLTAPKEAKNLIVVASSRNFRAGNINDISSFSSRGPAVDGRLGVTVAAPGEQIASARNDLGGSCSTAIPGTNNLYAFCSGTSMAAPHVAGAIVLATEWWRGFNEGADPSPAMAKALLVNSAVDMGTADIPNINEGWGRINITRLVNPDTEVLYYDQTHIFTDTGQQWVLYAGVPDTGKPLKITLAWTDAPGAVGANPALVNNLNLTVINGGNTYRGNAFSGGWSTTGGNTDNLNNLENVYIQNPAEGLTIIIDAVNIAGDGVLGNDDLTDQNFALVCSNCSEFPDFTLTVTPPALDICVPDEAVYEVAIGTILGYDDPVTLSVTGQPDGATAGFSVNPVTPPGDSLLTIGNTGAAAVGSYPLEITGMALTSTHTTTVQLNLFTELQTAPALLSPASGATDAPLQPTFTWDAVPGAATYLIEVATDFEFANVVDSAVVSDTSHTPGDALNPSSLYFWRVTASNACGDGAPSATFLFVTQSVNLFCNATPISIPSSGAATPYPSNITIGGFGSTISDVNVHLYDMNHTWPDDIDILLVGPQGQNLIIMSDAGGSNDLINVDLVLDDAAANSLPDSTQIVSGSYKPTNYGTGDTFPAPAPAPSAETLLAIFNGTDPNGTWSLYVVDDAGGDLGNINGGWCLELTGDSAGDAEITLTQTVGLDPDTYPLTDEITVPAGTEVTFFYRVENTGTIALPLHTLATSSFGTLLGPDHNYDLLPGESLTLTNSVVVTEPFSNTAIWLATTGGLDSAAASDTATVNVANLGISLSKTVGTEAGVCAATDAIEVEAGTQVYYCYTVENTGDEALALHDLVDDELGAIFLGLAYDLLPGESVNTVAAGLEISAIINETVTNTAVWTAYNDETFSTSASASATVTVVEPPPLYRILLPLILK
jgi:subtilisin-like proprotein convertase family protein